MEHYDFLAKTTPIREHQEIFRLLEHLIDIARKPPHSLTYKEHAEIEQITGR